MFIANEAVLAYCYIGKQSDTTNMCYLTKENLLVKYNGKISSFDHESILGIGFEHKFLLLPLVIGGILAPFSIHALLNTYISAWILLTLMSLGLLLLYYGWEGTSTLTIKTKVKDYDFFIKQPTANLKAFASYVEHFISTDPLARFFYFFRDRDAWLNEKLKGTLLVDRPIPLYNRRHIQLEKKRENEIILAIDPTVGDVQISFVKEENEDKMKAILTQNVLAADIHEFGKQ